MDLIHQRRRVTGFHRDVARCAVAMLWMFCSLGIDARELATTTACQAAGGSEPLIAALAAVERNPNDRQLQFSLADDWSAAGCFENAVNVLEVAARQAPRDREAATRLRVAQSVVGEERYFDSLDQVANEARSKRSRFRCTALADMEACRDAIRPGSKHQSLKTIEGAALTESHIDSQTPVPSPPINMSQTATASAAPARASVAPIDVGREPKIIVETAMLSLHGTQYAGSSRHAGARNLPPVTPSFSNREPDSESH